ncbi:hypothetical protein [Paraburkholderia sp. C35]|uniref:hypothetical protein n=1 Tax=Paraburkholderia sp. C35 TaxID=2126993 RepID=UPI000D6931DA|nr:hypothetical protein [Paraburkholderia sp. C35]
MDNNEERKATAHTAVLDPDRRNKTALKTGLVSYEDALSDAGLEMHTYHGWPGRESLLIGEELPYYEVTFKGKIYRALARAKPGTTGTELYYSSNFELARAWAPGLLQSGWLLDPPTSIPNTPRALLLEMQEVLDADAADILANAYCIMSYRRHHGATYPDTMEPAGYRFDQVFLMRVREDGTVNCLYETPSGVSPEKWTYFLRDLDRPAARERLGRYLASGMAERDFGKDGAAAMRAAVILRHGTLGAYDPLPFGHFAEVFKITEHDTRVEREVGGRRR